MPSGLKSCKTCVHLVADQDYAGRRVVRRDRIYTCAAPIPRLPDLTADLPACIRLRIERRMVEGSSMVNCPTYQKLVKVQK
jgi:hypothetical protein